MECKIQMRGNVYKVEDKGRPCYPKKGIMFRDITALIKDPVGFRLVVDNFTQRYIEGYIKFDAIVGIESRGLSSEELFRTLWAKGLSS